MTTDPRITVYGDGRRMAQGLDFDVNKKTGVIELTTCVSSITITTAADGMEIPSKPMRREAQWKREKRGRRYP